MNQLSIQRIFLWILALSLLANNETHAWSFPQLLPLGSTTTTTITTGERSSDDLTNDQDHRPLSPPWSFEASRIHYQFRLLPTKVAAKYCPKEVFLFHFLGMTLGGIFCVEYTNTPIGPYREVAFLSGLVGRRSGIGAWASHIVVDSEDAAIYGERFWGLPAEVLPIDLVEEEGRADGVAHVLLGEERVRISGWKTTSSSLEKGDPFASIFSWLDVSLPSFSGRLLRNDSSSTAALSPLLRYPLRIQSPGSISLVENGHIKIEGTGRIQTELEELFSDSLPLVSLQIDDVRLTAGVATVESD